MSGKFEVKAGQHQFLSGQQVVADIPYIPTFNKDGYILEFDVRHKIDNELLEKAPTYSLIDSKGTVRTGEVPKDGIIHNLSR